MPTRTVSTAEALEKLTAGNNRFTAGCPERPQQNEVDRIRCSTEGQRPFAVVLSCSDSRVPLEILFDRGIGDIFAVRVAGNVAGTDQIGSIEYGVDHLGIPLLVVLGHTQCGAVTAIVNAETVHGNIAKLGERIAPAVKKTAEANPCLSGKALIDECIKANVWQSIEDLFAASMTVREAVTTGKIEVIGACYDIREGNVHWMGRHPDQTRLVQST